MLLRVLYCSRTSLLLFYFARKGRRGGESERGIPFRGPSRFVNVTKMDTAILENKAAFSLCHDHQTFYIVCKKTANCSLKGDKMFYANGTDVEVKFNFFAFGCWQEVLCLWACAYATDHNKPRSQDIFLEIWDKLPLQILRGKPLRRVCAMMHSLTNNR